MGASHDRKLVHCEECFASLDKRHDFDAAADRICLRSRIDEQTPLWFKVETGVMKAAFKLRLQASLDLDGPKRTARQGHHEVDFGTGGRPVEIGMRPFGGGGNQGFDHKAFPAGTGNRMSKYIFARCES